MVGREGSAGRSLGGVSRWLRRAPEKDCYFSGQHCDSGWNWQAKHMTITKPKETDQKSKRKRKNSPPFNPPKASTTSRTSGSSMLTLVGTILPPLVVLPPSSAPSLPFLFLPCPLSSKPGLEIKLWIDKLRGFSPARCLVDVYPNGVSTTSPYCCGAGE